MLVVVSIEPRAYGQAIGTAIGGLRPRLVVSVVEPEELEECTRRLDPDVVICSRPNAFTANGRPSWIEFYPYAVAPDPEIVVDGLALEDRNVDLEKLAALVDWVSE